MEPMNEKSLYVISSFGQQDCRIHIGPYGTGKTFCLMLGFGVYCKTHNPGRLGFLLCGKTRQLAVSNMGDQLKDLFGENFKFTHRKSDDPKSKDALLFGHRIYFGGMNDKESINRVLGKSYKGILIDELSSLSLDNFTKLKGRLRGESPHWIESSTNPDGSPEHWLCKYLIEHKDEEFRWEASDNIRSDSKEYYSRLTKEYYGTPYYDRYVLGLWAAADGLVYGETFKPKYHIIDKTELIGARYKYWKVGIDFGMTNPTVGTLCGVMPDGEHIILEEFYKPNANNLEEIVGGLIALINKAPILKGVYVDPSAAVLIKELQTRGVTPIYKANNNVRDGIAKVNTMLNTGMLFYSSECKQHLIELATYAYKPSGDGDVIKEYDHCMDSDRYLIME